MKRKANLESIKKKEKQVKELAQAILKSKTLMIISIKGLPSKQFQDIKKTLRRNVSIRVAKKNILLRTIKALGRENAMPMEGFINESSAFAISELDAFELAGILSKNKTPLFAKAGQIAPADIHINEGPTDLVPGPAISELGALGLQISVENGKIAIKKGRVVVKQGEAIKENVASVLQKLNIQPFKIGLDPIAAYDFNTQQVYSDLKIDAEGALASLKEAAGKALGFAQRINYYCKETIAYLLAKANAQANHINKLNKPEGQ